MKIKIIEKVILTEEELNALNKTYGIIGDLYRMAPSDSELDKQLGKLLTSLSNFIEEATLEDN